MKLINMICPHCGAQLEIEEGRKQAYCGHCGSKLLIDDFRTQKLGKITLELPE